MESRFSKTTATKINKNKHIKFKHKNNSCNMKFKTIKNLLLIENVLTDTLNIHSPTVQQIINQPQVNINITLHRKEPYNISNLTTTLYDKNKILDCVFVNTFAPGPKILVYSLRFKNEYKNDNLMVKLISNGYSTTNNNRKFLSTEKTFKIRFKSIQTEPTSNSFSDSIHFHRYLLLFYYLVI